MTQVFWQKVYKPPQAFKENKAWLQKTGDLMTRKSLHGDTLKKRTCRLVQARLTWRSITR